MVNGEDYYTRKGDYVIKGLVICDDAARITWIKVGWPSSVHVNRVWSNSEIYVGRDKYFKQKEYMPGDSAFSTSAVMIPAFKKGHNSNLSEEKNMLMMWSDWPPELHWPSELPTHKWLALCTDLTFNLLWPSELYWPSNLLEWWIGPSELIFSSRLIWSFDHPNCTDLWTWFNYDLTLPSALVPSYQTWPPESCL